MVWKKSTRLRFGAVVVSSMLAWAAASASPSAGAAPAEPLLVPQGESISIEQGVQAPFIAPQPDIVLLVDRTGSMGPAITNVKSKIAGVIAAVRASEPDARFAVAAYCDSGERFPSYQTVAPLSADAASVIDAMIAMPSCYGGDLPEAQLDALYRIGGWGKAIAFRPDSQRIVAWFGDAPGHTRLRSEQAAIASLKAAKAHVVAVSVGRNQLDSTGQAGRITRATGGTLMSGVTPDRVASAILEGITSLPVEVRAHADCDEGLSVEFTANPVTIPRGTTATFEETVSVSPDATVGEALGCEVHFTMDGEELGSKFVQPLTVTVTEAAAAPTEAPGELSPAPTDNPTNTDGAANTEGGTGGDTAPSPDPAPTEPALIDPVPADPGPADQVPADQLPADQVPADQVPANQVPAEPAAAARMATTSAAGAN